METEKNCALDAPSLTLYPEKLFCFFNAHKFRCSVSHSALSIYGKNNMFRGKWFKHMYPITMFRIMRSAMFCSDKKILLKTATQHISFAWCHTRTDNVLDKCCNTQNIAKWKVFTLTTRAKYFCYLIGQNKMNGCCVGRMTVQQTLISAQGYCLSCA